MKKIISIIRKNLKLIIRSKISALIILFGPLLIMLVVGLAFNSSASLRINVGYYSQNYNNLTASFVDLLQETYNVEAFRSMEDCSTAIASGEIHICIEFPRNFEISNTQVNEIIFQVDNSKINFFETVVDSIERSFNKRAMELTQGMTQELLNRLNETSSNLLNQSSVVKQLKAENQLLKSDIDRVSAEVSNLDLDFNYNAFGVNDLEDETEDVSKAITKMKGYAEDAIEEGEILIERVDDELTAAGLNMTDYPDLMDALNETGDELNSIQARIDGSESFNSSKLTGLVGGLKDSLRDVEDKFVEASDARDTTVNKILSINTKLNQSMQKILVVEGTFNAITASIQGTEVTDLQSITNPITKKVVPIVTEESQLNYFFPYLVVLITMFIGLLLSSTLVIMEKTSKAHFRNFVTPTSDLVFVFGTYVTGFLIMVLQLFIVLGIFSLYFGKNISSNFGSTFLVLAIMVTLFSWLGMIIGNLFNTEETGTLASISIGSILLFVSDLVFPLERMPATVAYLARNYNPFVIGTEMLRRTMLLGRPIGGLGKDLWLVMSYLAIFLILVMLTHKMFKRNYLLRWGGYVARRELRLEKQIEEEGMLMSHYENIEAKDYFVTKDEKKIPNFKELVDFAENISDEKYKDYVNQNENLFADWIENVLKNDSLALRIRTAKRRGRLLREMKQGLKLYEKIRQKRDKKKPKPDQKA